MLNTRISQSSRHVRQRSLIRFSLFQNSHPLIVDASRERYWPENKNHSNSYRDFFLEISVGRVSFYRDTLHDLLSNRLYVETLETVR